MKKVRQILWEKGPFKILVNFFLVYAIKFTFFLSDSFETCTDCLYHCKD